MYVMTSRTHGSSHAIFLTYIYVEIFISFRVNNKHSSNIGDNPMFLLSRSYITKVMSLYGIWLTHVT